MPSNTHYDPNREMQEPFILQYKLDNCASDFHDVEGRKGEEQTEREEEGKRHKGLATRPGCGLREKGGESERNAKWGGGVGTGTGRD